MKSQSIELFFKEGSSDKIYKASLDAKDKGWIVNFAYGRRGSSLTIGTKTNNPVSYDAALKVYYKLVDSKTTKGYTEDVSAKPFTGVVADSEDTGIRPQLLNEIEESEIVNYLTNDSWCAQEKFDGRRRLLFTEDTVKGTVPRGTNRKGLVVALEKELLDELSEYADEAIFDGEAVGDKVMVFDLLDKTLRSNPYKSRYLELKGIIEDAQVGNSSQIKLVKTAWTTSEKKALYKKLLTENAEGIVFKHINGAYKAGRPNSGGDQLKFKFYATASCMVGRVNSTKRSVSLNVFDNDLNPVNVGNVTVYPNQDIPDPGDIVEVKYLYYFEGGSLFQPVLIGKRDDIEPDDCKLSKLKVKRETEEI